MPIQAIIQQPAAGALLAAYRPIVLRVEAIRTGGATIADKPPVVYCDCYIPPPNTAYTFHKSLSRTQSILSGGTRYFEFDIQDPAQECVQTVLPPYGGQQIIDLWKKYIKPCLIRFRSSGYDSDGLIETEDVAPVQATGDIGPSGGSGTESNPFYVLNATIQHPGNQDLTAHLAAYRTGTWDGDFYPVSHRPAKYFITPDDSDYFPVCMPAGWKVTFYRLRYRYTNQATFWETDIDVQFPGLDPVTSLPIIQNYFETFTDPTVIYMPCGPVNLQPLVAAAISFRDIAEYSVQLVADSGAVVAETPVHQVVKYDERIRIHFQNYLGTIDALNFNQWSTAHESKSDTTQSPLSYPLDKTRHSQRRFNIRSNDSYTAISVEYDENAQAWVDELLDAPNAWMEVAAFEDQPPTLLPIVITDRKAEKRKLEDRYVYEATSEFKLSHERITIRN